MSTYISVDVEADGPIPGPYSMLSLGAVAFDTTGKELGDFSCNLRPLPGARTHPDTMAWWDKHKAAYLATGVDQQDPRTAMTKFDIWMALFSGPLTFVGYPASFDFMFVYWYLINFVGKSRFGFQALDIKTYAAAVLHIPFKKINKRIMPKYWLTDDNPHTHNAVDDAREQGNLFFRMISDHSYNSEYHINAKELL
jgi:hypothetical protein